MNTYLACFLVSVAVYVTPIAVGHVRASVYRGRILRARRIA